jgi:hypothetical protein
LDSTCSSSSGSSSSSTTPREGRASFSSSSWRQKPPCCSPPPSLPVPSRRPPSSPCLRPSWRQGSAIGDPDAPRDPPTAALLARRRSLGGRKSSGVGVEVGDVLRDGLVSGRDCRREDEADKLVRSFSGLLVQGTAKEEEEPGRQAWAGGAGGEEQKEERENGRAG